MSEAIEGYRRFVIAEQQLDPDAAVMPMGMNRRVDNRIVLFATDEDAALDMAETALGIPKTRLVIVPI